jgi:hypothetical protein
MTRKELEKYVQDCGMNFVHGVIDETELVKRLQYWKVRLKEKKK